MEHTGLTWFNNESISRIEEWHKDTKEKYECREEEIREAADQVYLLFGSFSWFN